MKYTTDLAIESTQMLGSGSPDGVEVRRFRESGAEITAVHITNEKGANALGKSVGRYVTLEVTPFSADAELFDGRLDAVAGQLEKLLPERGTVLVACLGNDKITPDALGPQAAQYVLATRHITGELARSVGLEDLRGVAAVVPGVLGQTGIETGEIIKGVVSCIKPAAVIVIDALAAMSVERLGSTVQISDAGIVPGSGVGNHRFEISRKTLGVPVVAMGIPTVVDGATLAGGLIDKTKVGELSDIIEPNGRKMMVTPREIDSVIERGAKLLGMSINQCLQKNFAPEDIMSLLG